MKDHNPLEDYYCPKCFKELEWERPGKFKECKCDKEDETHILTGK